MTIEQLPGEVPPSELLEQRTVDRLRALGLLRRGSSNRWKTIAAGLLIFLAGAAGGALVVTERAAEPGDPRFLLLLYGAGTTSAEEEQRTVSAYRAWAMQLAEHGRFVSGERLGAESASVPNGMGDDPVRGYFVVSAASFDEAVGIARTSPHVERGGRVVVRRIE